MRRMGALTLIAVAMICTALMVAGTAADAQLDGWVFVITVDPLTDEVEAGAVTQSDGNLPHTVLLSCKTQEHRVHFSVQGDEFVEPPPRKAAHQRTVVVR